MAMRVKKLEINPRVDEEIYGDSDSESSPSNSPTSHRSINSCFSGSISDEEDEEDVVEDDNCLDDWEAVVDALTVVENKQQKNNPSSENGSQSGAKNECLCGNDISNENQKSGGTGICQAWRPGDAFRPQSLPNLSLQLNSERQCAPTSCPICFEDLGGTDSSFFPCVCGFRLCRFCHNRILEDWRCPGCRKKYDCDVFE